MMYSSRFRVATARDISERCLSRRLARLLGKSLKKLRDIRNIFEKLSGPNISFGLTEMYSCVSLHWCSNIGLFYTIRRYLPSSFLISLFTLRRQSAIVQAGFHWRSATHIPRYSIMHMHLKQNIYTLNPRQMCDQGLGAMVYISLCRAHIGD